MATPHARYKFNGFFRQLLFVAVIIALGCLIFTQLKFWVGAFLGAITIYMVFRRFMFRLVENSHWPKWIASLFILFITCAILSALGFAAYKVIFSEASSFDPKELVDSVSGLSDKVNDFAGMQVVPENIAEKSEGVVTTVLKGVFNTTYSFTANIIMMLFILYFLLVGGRRMECRILQYSPFRGDSLTMLKSETKNMIFSNAVLMPIILVLQTLVAALGYWMVGMDKIFFWGFLTGLAGLLPVVGTMIVYVPISVYLLATGQVWQGLVLFAFGMSFISNTDNVIRIIFMKRAANTHPMIVIFGVILGIPVFGFWGIIFGPLLLSAFVLLIRIYYVEYGLLDPDRMDAECNKDTPWKVPKHMRKFAARAEKFNERRTSKKSTSEKVGDMLNPVKNIDPTVHNE